MVFAFDCIVFDRCGLRGHLGLDELSYQPDAGSGNAADASSNGGDASAGTTATGGSGSTTGSGSNATSGTGSGATTAGSGSIGGDSGASSEGGPEASTTGGPEGGGASTGSSTGSAGNSGSTSDGGSDAGTTGRLDGGMSGGSGSTATDGGKTDGGTATAGEGGKTDGGTTGISDAGKIDGGTGGTSDGGSDGSLSDGSSGAKSPPGTICTMASECSSGICGGRCCEANSTCTCLQPGPSNLLVNPGFDTDLLGWAVEPGDGMAFWAPQDSMSCPFSGSAYITLTGTTSPRISQCVAIKPSTNYDFGVSMRTGAGGYTHCDVDLFAGPYCTGGSSNVVDTTWINVGWSPDLTASFQSFENVVSARVSCFIEAADAVYFDMVYLSPSPDGY